MASMASVSSSTTTGSIIDETMCNRSASTTILAMLACSPPSIQPAPCIIMLTPPITQPHSANTLSYAACASTALAAHTLLLR